MKNLILAMAVFLITLTTNCGLRESAKETKEVRDAVEKMATEMNESLEAAEEQKDLSVEEITETTLKALQSGDMETLKKMVQPTMALYIDDDYMGHHAKSVEGWNGEIIEVRYRKDQRTGLPQAAAHFDNVDDENIKIHVLDYMNQWFAMGGAFPFEEISKEEFEQYSTSIE